MASSLGGDMVPKAWAALEGIAPYTIYMMTDENYRKLALDEEIDPETRVLALWGPNYWNRDILVVREADLMCLGYGDGMMEKEGGNDHGTGS